MDIFENKPGLFRGTLWLIVYAAALALLLFMAWRPSASSRATILAAASPSPTATDTILPTQPPTATPTETMTETPTSTPTASPTVTLAPATPTPTLTSTPPPTMTPTPRAPTPTVTATESATPSVAAQLATPQPHLWLERPVGPEAKNRVDRFYPYGATGEGQYPVHHGVEFIKPTGTVVLAVAPARVEFAGDDSHVIHSYKADFYGQLVVLRLEMTYQEKPIFALYGHLSKIYVQQGQLVDPGEPLGEIGMTGVALGPHLHFEVRVGENDYWEVRNPELWLRPLPGEGVIAGQVLNAQGKPLPEVVVAISQAENSQDPWRQTWTYAVRDIKVNGSRKLDTVKSDDEWPENWAMGDVPAGEYIVGVRINGRTYTSKVTVKAGEVSYITMVIP